MIDLLPGSRSDASIRKPCTRSTGGRVAILFSSSFTDFPFQRPGRPPERITPLLLLAAAESIQHALAESLIHEAIDNGVNTSRGIGQKMDEGYWSSGEAISRTPVESLPRIHHKNRGPADEEEENYDQKHPDDAFFGHEVGCRAAAANTPHHGLCGTGEVGTGQCDALLFSWLKITTVAVPRFDAACAGLALLT